MSDDRCPKCDARYSLVGRRHLCRRRNVVDGGSAGVITKGGLEQLRQDISAEAAVRPTLRDSASPFYGEPAEEKGQYPERIIFTARKGTMAALEGYRVKRGLRSTSAAIRALIERGLG